ncbi:Hypothetical predicted protein [Pelobates cultripes]|uniref:Uncharacterized protein n=1 Tax=Pelobates cultripes TaxID=61616 RepID=A0AAD1WSW9_PELCU|nr:Hypothetical predicted protein [Pelobates cultripes]
MRSRSLTGSRMRSAGWIRILVSGRKAQASHRGPSCLPGVVLTGLGHREEEGQALG